MKVSMFSSVAVVGALVLAPAQARAGLHVLPTVVTTTSDHALRLETGARPF